MGERLPPPSSVASDNTGWSRSILVSAAVRTCDFSW